MLKSQPKTKENVVNPAVVAADKNKIMHTALLNKLSLQLAVTATQREQVKQLLTDHKLPVTDINEDTLLYLLLDDEQAAGTAGLEIFQDCALLRSFSVNKNMQGRGYGRFISDAIEKYAAGSGISCLYLLTTSAKDFFDKQGYCVIKRDDAPDGVQQSAEFTSLCPSSAVVMKKKI